MFGLVDLWCRMVVPGYAEPVTREQLGHRGGDPGFTPPLRDRVAEVQYGVAPTTEHSAVEPWWYRL
jgi:hypothetical protein